MSPQKISRCLSASSSNKEMIKTNKRRNKMWPICRIIKMYRGIKIPTFVIHFIPMLISCILEFWISEKEKSWMWLMYLLLTLKTWLWSLLNGSLTHPWSTLILAILLIWPISTRNLPITNISKWQTLVTTLKHGGRAKSRHWAKLVARDAAVPTMKCVWVRALSTWFIRTNIVGKSKWEMYK